MRVRLAQMWFDHQGKRWREGEHDMPDKYKEFLPESAIVLNEDGKEVAVEKGKDPLTAFKKK